MCAMMLGCEMEQNICARVFDRKGAGKHASVTSGNEMHIERDRKCSLTKSVIQIVFGLRRINFMDGNLQNIVEWKSFTFGVGAK